MTNVIKLLPDHVANQIAAGEVVQRPASVVKELLENSIDAGSTEIKLIIKNSGKTLIQVVDNGEGMSYKDARMCFERHATSKISTAKDLFNLNTKGFFSDSNPAKGFNHIFTTNSLTNNIESLKITSYKVNNSNSFAIYEHILNDNLEKLHVMADALLKYETIDADQIDDIMAGAEPREPKDWNDDDKPKKTSSKDSSIKGPAEEL